MGTRSGVIASWSGAALAIARVLIEVYKFAALLSGRLNAVGKPLGCGGMHVGNLCRVNEVASAPYPRAAAIVPVWEVAGWGR